MTPLLHITLYRTAARWYWVVQDQYDPDDFVTGESWDYAQACADALKAHDDFLKRRSE